ncbi:hypothetical protein [Ectopseudomonas hydrolytica]|nr:hypothetical protein [Pseudomonas hydrolytica]MBF8164063.1 hypothetical protein [Pseudomonas mendocina]UTH33089.1 hypothetical protein NLY38_07200 [Pseudomonas hydrolytica]UZZ12316.1 hypothetical protein NDO41_07525 [Pseudomonas mendocina]
MTIRKYINTRKRLANLSLYGGLLISAAAAQYSIKARRRTTNFLSLREY